MLAGIFANLENENQDQSFDTVASKRELCVRMNVNEFPRYQIQTRGI